MKFKKQVKRAEMSNLIDAYVNGNVDKEMDSKTFFQSFEEPVTLLTEVIK